MKVLFLSNYYPPKTRGGYEQWCAEVASELVARGHRVCVLTSDGGGANALSAAHEDRGVEVRRVLHLEVESGLVGSAVRLLGRRAQLEHDNVVQVRKAIAEFEPDTGLIWGMWNVPRSVPALTEQLLVQRLAYYFCDYWPSLPSAYLQQWQEPARRWIGGLPKQILGRPIVARLTREPAVRLAFANPICVSRAVRDQLVRQGVAVEHAQIIYGGTHIRDFHPPPRVSNGQARQDSLKLLYAGRLTETKGVHTAIRAMAALASSGEHRVTLDVVGGGDPEYERELIGLVEKHHLTEQIRFRGGVSHTEMPRVLGDHDVLLLLSEWEEPFARIVLEAMAVGLVVIGTTTGGTGEILVEDQTGLTFPRGDASALCGQIRRLVERPEERARLARTGRQVVEDRFTFRRMVDELEAALTAIGVGGHV
jgi:glycogen(starch) synthase